MEIHNKIEPFHGGIEKHEYNLRQFIDFATRWNIENVYKEVKPNDKFPYSDKQVENLRIYYDLFQKELNYKLTNASNWKAIEIDLKAKFIPMINQYIEWYELNILELEKFNPYNFYEWFYAECKMTKRDILNYFPEKPEKKKKTPPTYTGLFRNSKHATEVKGILETKGYTVKNKWVHNGAIYDLAKIYFMLVLADFGLNLIKITNFKIQLECLYKEFGINEYKMDNLYKAQKINIDFDKIYLDLYPEFKKLNKVK